MFVLFQRVKDRYQQTGLGGVLVWGFFAAYIRSVRRVMPESGCIKYNGIDIGEGKRFGDRLAANLYPDYHWRDIDTYEQALVKALSDHVSAGDTVTVVGGGVGVTVVHAAIRVGEHGRVDCFEGDINGVGSVNRTALRNGVAARVHVHHAIVGENIGVYGDSGGADQVSALNLPVCDVLELDCEGSEIGILSKMSIRPRCIAVETHGFLGAPTSKVHELLVELGYAVEHLGPAEPHLRDVCMANDIMVLVGVLGQTSGSAGT